MLYLSYLKFKKRNLQNKDLAAQLANRDWNPKHCKNKGQGAAPYDSIFDGYECYLCKLAHDARTDRTRYQADSSHFSCPAPKRFNDRGKYEVYDRVWAEEWIYGKYEAMVMERLINENKVISKKEFDRAVRAVQQSDVNYLKYESV